MNNEIILDKDLEDQLLNNKNIEFNKIMSEDFDIDKCVNIISIYNNNYQRRLVFIISCIIVVLNTTVVLFPFFKLTPQFYCNNVNNDNLYSNIQNNICSQNEVCSILKYTKHNKFKNIKNNMINNFYRDFKTWSTQYDLLCDKEYIYSFILSVYFLGIMLGNCITNLFADKYGRKIVIFVSIIFYIVLGILVVYINSFIILIVYSFLLGLITSYILLCGFVIVFESSDTKNKTINSAILALSYPVAGVFNILIFSIVKDWIYSIILSIIFMFILIIFFNNLVYESLEYLYHSENYSKLVDTLYKVSIINKSKLELNKYMLSINIDVEYNEILNKVTYYNIKLDVNKQNRHSSNIASYEFDRINTFSKFKIEQFNKQKNKNFFKIIVPIQLLYFLEEKEFKKQIVANNKLSIENNINSQTSNIYNNNISTAFNNKQVVSSSFNSNTDKEEEFERLKTISYMPSNKNFSKFRYSNCKKTGDNELDKKLSVDSFSNAISDIDSSKIYSILEILTLKSQLIKISVLCISKTICFLCLNYFNFAVANFGIDPFLAGFILYTFEFLIKLLAVSIYKYLGGYFTIIIVSFIGGITFIANYILNNLINTNDIDDNIFYKVLLIILGKSSISILHSAYPIFAAEIFIINIRFACLGLFGLICNLGGVFSSFLINIGSTSYLILGILLLIGIILVSAIKPKNTTKGA